MCLEMCLGICVFAKLYMPLPCQLSLLSLLSHKALRNTVLALATMRPFPPLAHSFSAIGFIPITCCHNLSKVKVSKVIVLLPHKWVLSGQVSVAAANFLLPPDELRKTCVLLVPKS